MIAAPYVSAINLAPALRSQYALSRIARCEWRAICREEGIAMSDPLYSDPTLDCQEGKMATSVEAGKKCLNCNKSFISKSHSAKFCCPTCRFAFNKKLKKEERS